MTGHATDVHNTHAKLIAGALTADADHEHESQENEMDRGHEAAITGATLANQEHLAKLKPRPSP
jgi:hypothetical protein